MKTIKEKIFATADGEIHYWVNQVESNQPWLVLLPGLTADYHLFDKQIEYFQGKYNILVWDAPAHGKSRPFKLNFTVDDLAQYLHEILVKEKVVKPVFVGQSMGGYLSQAYMELYPESVGGFISIDSSSLKRRYYAGWEMAFLRHTTGMYMSIPWKMLVKWVINGLACSDYGRQYMSELMKSYNKKEYCHLIGYGYRIFVDAIETNREYKMNCPVLLLCGDKDGAGSVKRYNRVWAKEEGHKLVWLKNAGHNANTDLPEEVNRLIEEFVNEKQK